MACTDCGKTEQGCGCEQEALHISQICNPIVCDVEECSETFNAGCILYADEDIICNDVVLVTAGDTMAQALANVSAYFCSTETIGNEILCGLDVVVPTDTSLEDAIPLVVAYFCNAIANVATFNSADVSFVDNQDIITGCKVRVYTITYYKGVDPGPYVPVDTLVFETPEICPQYNPCSSTSVPTPNPPGFIDSVLMCREGELGTEPVQIEWFDLLSSVPEVCDAPIVNELNVTDQTSDSIIICRDVEGVQTTVKIPWVDFRIQRQPWAYFYTANLSQEALLDPVAQVPPDVIGLVGNLNINWTRVGVGIYHGTSVGKFVGVTICSITQGMFGFPQPGIIQFSNNGNDRVEIHTFNANGVYTDSIIRSASVDIKVYPV